MEPGSRARTLDDAARAEAPGRFVRLDDGVTHYEAAGPDTAPVVVLCAGFSVPAYITDSLYQGLADSVRQLSGLLDSLRIDRAVNLASISFGAAIVSSFTQRHPERVRSLVYLDPVFNARRPLSPEERSPWAWNVHMVFRGGSEAMARGQMADFLHPERNPDWVERYRAQQRFAGTREALRRTRAAIAVEPHQGPLLRSLGAEPRPVLVVWGRLDPVAPFAGSGPLLAAMPRAAFVPVDSAAHLPHLERPERSWCRPSCASCAPGRATRVSPRRPRESAPRAGCRPGSPGTPPR
ncbi:MAG TPA: alpha/beta fold hydrolase [Gemmatimonadales bacterium]|nr:alpha/beta fold hydrolase [Gemmatimonadales bacterium]